MVAVDRANSLYANWTLHQKPDFSRYTAHELALVLHVRKFFKSNWKNGVCVLVADEAEFSTNRKDTQTIRLYSPPEMFGEKVCEKFWNLVNQNNFRALMRSIRLSQF